MQNDRLDFLRKKCRNLPLEPGVYIMRDKSGKIIYIGKAKVLKNRVSSYFRNLEKHLAKVYQTVMHIYDFDYIVTQSEFEALVLECSLIKQHLPKYNILLKDDKTYPYVKVDVKELFPTFSVSRKIKKDGAKYFGPFMGGVSAKNVLEIINLAFLTRPCDKKLNPNKPIKECLNYHIKKCSAPCTGCVSRDEYMAKVNSAMDFLSGDMTFTENLLKEKILFFHKSSPPTTNKRL